MTDEQKEERPEHYRVTVRVQPGKDEPGHGAAAMIRYVVDRSKVLAPGYPAGIRSLVQLFEKSIFGENDAPASTDMETRKKEHVDE